MIESINYYLIQENHLTNQIIILKHFTDKYNGLHEIEQLAESYIKEKHSEIDIKYYVTNDINIQNYYYIKKTRLNGVTVCKNDIINHSKIISWYLTDISYCCEIDDIFSYEDNLRYQYYECKEQFDKVLFELKYKKDINVFKQYDKVMCQLKTHNDYNLVFNMDE